MCLYTYTWIRSVLLWDKILQLCTVLFDGAQNSLHAKIFGVKIVFLFAENESLSIDLF